MEVARDPETKNKNKQTLQTILKSTDKYYIIQAFTDPSYRNQSEEKKKSVKKDNTELIKNGIIFFNNRILYPYLQNKFKDFHPCYLSVSNYIESYYDVNFIGHIFYPYLKSRILTEKSKILTYKMVGEVFIALVYVHWLTLKEKNQTGLEVINEDENQQLSSHLNNIKEEEFENNNNMNFKIIYTDEFEYEVASNIETLLQLFDKFNYTNFMYNKKDILEDSIDGYKMARQKFHENFKQKNPQKTLDDQLKQRGMKKPEYQEIQIPESNQDPRKLSLTIWYEEQNLTLIAEELGDANEIKDLLAQSMLDYLEKSKLDLMISLKEESKKKKEQEEQNKNKDLEEVLNTLQL